jgi:hypothetical protein
MSASEYWDKFIQLSRYAPADVADDEEKQDAILVEHARQEMGEQKRKFEPSGQINNNSRPRYAPPQGTPFHPGGQNVNFGQS